MTLVDNQPTSTFTTEALARLAAYRAAVTAGFYTDWDGSASTTDTEALAWVHDSTAHPGGYPFTVAELARLERTRQAVAAGYYSEDLAVR